MKCPKCGNDDDRRKWPSETVFDWLRSNLGSRALAPLTGTDTRCLAAAVNIVECYAHDRKHSTLYAFGQVVRRMQQSTIELAYHSVAHVMDWSDRATVWDCSGLAPLQHVRQCSFEPGGSHKDLADEEELVPPVEVDR